jgi:hypothetical protein
MDEGPLLSDVTRFYEHRYRCTGWSDVHLPGGRCLSIAWFPSCQCRTPARRGKKRSSAWATSCRSTSARVGTSGRSTSAIVGTSGRSTSPTGRTDICSAGPQLAMEVPGLRRPV